MWAQLEAPTKTLPTGHIHKGEKIMRNTSNTLKTTRVNTKTKPVSERIFAKNVFVNNDTHITNRNNNDLIVGPTRGGKTRGYIIPNLLRAKENMIVADTKGNLYRLFGDYLRSKGFDVQCIDFKDIENSLYGYNPLSYVRKTRNPDLIAQGDLYNEQDIKKIALAICPIQDYKNPFWDLASQMYLEMFIIYILNNYPEDKRNLKSAYEMLCLMGTEEFNVVISEEIERYPNSAFAKKCSMIRQNSVADKMDSSIKGILAQHLDAICYSTTECMYTNKKQVDFSSFLKRKNVLFLNVSDSDRSQDTLVNIFYTQAFRYLMSAADNRPDSRLPIPVRFLLDDFSTNTVIPDFDKLISVIGSREISVSLIVQSLSQLNALYNGEKAKTIINNCDHCLYLGGTDIDTARHFAEKINCQISTVLNLPLDSAFFFERGCAPVKVEKYDLEADKIYAKLTKNQENTVFETKSTSAV